MRATGKAKADARRAIGIGFDAAGLVGADFDHCVTDSGSLTPLAVEVLGYAETYGETSPSGDLHQTPQHLRHFVALHGSGPGL